MLTNSAINIPVTVTLVGPLAERIGLTKGATNYVALPEFLTLNE